MVTVLAAHAQSGQQYLMLRILPAGADNTHGGAFHDVRMRLAQTPGVLSASYLMADAAFLIVTQPGVDLGGLVKDIKGVQRIYTLTPEDYQIKRREFFMQKLMANRDRKWQPTPSFPVYRNTGNAALDEKIYTEAVIDWIETHPKEFEKLF
jgi:hypothetical protein